MLAHLSQRVMEWLMSNIFKVSERELGIEILNHRRDVKHAKVEVVEELQDRGGPGTRHMPTVW